MKEDIHVTHQDGSGWVVQRSEEASTPLANFRRRAIAEAFGRALAHRHRVELVVHRADGKQVRYHHSALSYAAHLS